MTTETESPTLDALMKLSSAEDMFAYLGLEPDRHILNVARLHIMKRFGSYLRSTDFSGQSEDEVLAQTREALARAHDDFVASTPLAEKVFKVFETQAARQANKFVGLDSLKINPR
ncbi:nitrogenase-stabilizing/protective protein [Rhodobacter aestuarii]|uniref:Nitrogenase-stabilizing/protective protein NifW n=1 Tax=Rhodobacter aestuarii TaxID=453582 RepID=A0A1N7NT74_9RHOB|nr:nitrogenase stabilizing/protective protein NifW [Rhodobacter aestuarii]PTV94568.1 nitrogenase-stabilizing/protective protein [Rhodobacter aestuarii]SIT01486.1 nitrogenase-stabilizing/protective protein [Rhodobacter aestuarii]